ncbi:MAG: lamin tail domain-containing protein [Pirellulales bacterium]|nr:lamin tail domain-containing protein [Pirellulales bacterium]
MASNDSSLVDGDGNNSDWIEIYNPTESIIDLAGWSLTDDPDELSKWTFPDIPTVPQEVLDLVPGEFLMVFASGHDAANYVDAGGNLHTNFQLKATGEYLTLVRPDGVTIEHAYTPEFPPQTSDISYGLAFDVTSTPLIAEGASAQYIIPSGTISNWNTLDYDDSSWATGSLGIGYETSPADYLGFIETAVPDNTASLYLRQSFPVVDPDAFDQMILSVRYDDGFIAYLNGMRVASDNEPASPLWNSSASSGHPDSEAVQFTEFDISDYLAELVVGNNVLAIHALNLSPSSDMLIETKLVANGGNVTEPLDPGFLRTPSPGSANGDSFQGFVADTDASIDRGFFETPITVDLTTPTPGATLVYTTDGSLPSLTHGVQILPPDLHTAPSGSVFIDSTTVLRTAAFKDDFVPTCVGTHTYIFIADVITSDVMDRAITEHATYAPWMERALTDLPSISLVFTHPESYTEQITSVEWISPDSTDGFQVDAGISWYGGYYTEFAKKNFRLYFRSEYGPSRLEYPLFDGFDRGLPAVQVFDQLDLRSGSHDMSQRGFYMSNRFTDDTMLDMGHLAPHGRFVHLYINGVYWGQYHLRERWNADMLAQYQGGDKDDYEAINGNLNVGGWSPGDAYDGDGSGWENIKSLAGNYEAIQQFLNVANYIDYMLLYMSGNSENEYRTGGIPDGSSPYIFFLNDADGWLRSVSDRTGDVGPGNILSGLLAEGHPDFLTLLADRIHKHFFNDGALTPEKNIARLEERLEEIEYAFIAESARWGYRSPASWQSAAADVINNLFPTLTQTMIDRLRARRLYPNIDAPTLSQHGGLVPSGFQIELSVQEIPVSDNLALWRPAIQSSDGYGFTGAQAVNGDTTDFSHTADGDLHPFLEVDLEGDALIERIVMHNRDSCCQNRLYNISVEIRDANDQIVFTSPVFNPVPEGGTPTSPGDYITLNLAYQPGGGIIGHKIRVCKTAVNGPNSSEWLSLGELVVFGEYLDPPDALEIYYTLDGSDPRLPGGSLNPNAILYEGTPITINTGATVRSRTLQGTKWSALDEAIFTVAPLADESSLRVSEILFNPYDALLQFGDLDVDHDEFEFVELLNAGDQTIDLAGTRFVQVPMGDHLEGIDFTFGQQILTPGEHVLVVKNQAAFESRYGIGHNIAGEFSDHLANGGEWITLWAADGSVIQQFEYDDAGNWPSRTDGFGSSLVIVDPEGDYNAPSNWRASTDFGGTPGENTIDTVDIIINEVLAHTDLPQVDFIELYNLSEAAVGLGNWWISDSPDNYFKYQVPTGTTLASGGYYSLDETNFNAGGENNPVPFALSAAGDDIWLLAADATGKPTRFADVVSFDATLNGVSLGRVPNGSTQFDLFPLSEVSLGSANAGHLVGDLIISEIHYHPGPPPTGSAITEQQLEFVELYNRSGDEIQLNDPLIGSWRVRGAIEFDFDALPIRATLGAGEVLVVVPFNPLDTILASEFRAIHQIDYGVNLVGPYDGQLDNGGEEIRLLAPTAPPQGANDPVHYLIDRVTYDDSAPWPSQPDGAGPALARITDEAFGDDPANWLAMVPTPGSVPFVSITPGDFDADNDVDSTDLDLWHAGFGTRTGATRIDGDADADGDVDGNDFLAWQIHFASSGSSGKGALSRTDSHGSCKGANKAGLFCHRTFPFFSSQQPLLLANMSRSPAKTRSHCPCSNDAS